MFKHNWRYSMQWRFYNRKSRCLAARQELETWLRNVAKDHGYYGLISVLLGNFAKPTASEVQPWRAFMHTFKCDARAQTPTTVEQHQFGRRYDSPSSDLWPKGARMQSLRHPYAGCAQHILFGGAAVTEHTVQKRHHELGQTMSAYDDAERTLMRQLEGCKSNSSSATRSSRDSDMGVDEAAALVLLNTYGIQTTHSPSGILQNTTKSKSWCETSMGGRLGSQPTLPGSTRSVLSTSTAAAAETVGIGSSKVTSIVFVRRVLNILVADTGLNAALQTVRDTCRRGPAVPPRDSLAPRPPAPQHVLAEDTFDGDLQRAMAMSLVDASTPQPSRQVGTQPDTHHDGSASDADLQWALALSLQAEVPHDEDLKRALAMSLQAEPSVDREPPHKRAKPCQPRPRVGSSGNEKDPSP